MEVHLHPHQPQAVAVKEAAVKEFDSTLEYFIKAEDFPKMTGSNIVLVDAQTILQPSSRPGSAAASPNPLVGIRIAGILEAVITEAHPVYQAP